MDHVPGGVKVGSRDTLEKWLNPQDRRKPDFTALAVFCQALGDHAPIQALVAPIGVRIIGRDDAARLDLLKAEEEMEALRLQREEEERNLKARIARLREEIK